MKNQSLSPTNQSLACEEEEEEYQRTFSRHHNREVSNHVEEYVASPLTPLRAIIAYGTLFFFFATALFYVIWLPLLFTLEWSIIAATTAFIYTLFAKQQPWPRVIRSYVFETWRSYFSLRVIYEEKPPNHALCAVLPHGLFPLGLVIAAGVYESPLQHRMAIASFLFKVPILASLLRWLGAIEADKQRMSEALLKGQCFVLPDGLIGTYYSNSEFERLYLKERKGFIKLAIEHKVPIVPVYCFGHTQLFDVYPSAGSWIANMSRKMRFALVAFWPIIPRRVPITIVFGKPIYEESASDGTMDQQVDACHKLFIESITNLFDRYKMTHGWPESKQLEIV